MNDFAIKVEQLSKKYVLGSGRSGSFRETINVLMGNRKKRPIEDFWALKDVSFEIGEGEAVGIIGRNGAGKSTLLKVLSRITEPTKGRLTIKGRVASLLEVGTGFHPELTGKENIYLNGTILGMTRREVKAKFDQIVDFSGVEKFIDTPVKRYSSGMYVRLAFAVAAHLEPEILVVDEVLAVGDIDFQKKCLGKMGEVRSQGRTVLFVSHSMSAIKLLCTRGIVLSEGSILFQGEIEDCINKYLTIGDLNSARSLMNREDRKGSGLLQFTDWEITDANGNKIDHVLSGQDIIFRFFFKKHNIELRHVLFWFQIIKSGEVICTLHTELTGGNFKIGKDTEGSVSCAVRKIPFFKGTYSINLLCNINKEFSDYIENAGKFNVENGDFFESGILPKEEQGILINHNWSLN